MVENMKLVPSSYDNRYYLVNNGTINIGVDTNASLVLGIGSAQDLEQNSYISNSGSMVINADDNASLIAGISVNGGMDDDAYISNSGSIEFNANNNTNKASGIDIEEGMSGNALIKNGGTITGNVANGEFIDGIRVLTLRENSSIVNDGNIILTETNSSDSDNYLDGIDIDSMEYNASVYNNGLISLNFTQNSVSGGATGIFVFDNRSNDEAKIVNNGNIEIRAESEDADSYFYLSGLYKEGTTGYDKIINKGLISISSKAADMDIEGIYAGDVYDNATVENAGDIMISTDYVPNSLRNILLDELGKNTGIYINNLAYEAGIINSGGIYFSTSQESIGGIMIGIDIRGAKHESFILNSGDIVMNTKTDLNDSQLRLGGILIERGLDDNSVLTNSGNIIINAKADDTDIKGISIEYYGLEVNAYIENSGLISVGVNSLSSDNVIGINTDDLSDDTRVENSGKINVDVNSDGANIIAGIYVDDMSDDAQVVNSGAININTHSTKSKAINGIYVDSMKADNSIINTGSITVDSTSEGLYAAGIYVNGVEEGAYFENKGSIISSAYSVFVDRDSNFSLSNTGYMSGIIYAPLTVIDNGKNGVISLSSLDESDVKDFYNEEGAVLEFSLNTEDNGSVKYAKLNASDKVVVSDNSTLGFKVDSGFYSSTTDGEVLNEIVKTPEMDINISSVNVSDNSLFVDFKLEKSVSSDGNETLNAVVDKHTIADVAVSIGSESSVLSVANVLDSKMNTATGEMKTFLDKLIMINDPDSMNRAIQEITPATTASMSKVAFNAVSSISGVVQSRQTALRGLNSGDVLFSNRHIWFKPFGTHTTQDDKDGKNGFVADTYGFGIGMDGEYDEMKTAGISFFYTKLNSDTNNIDQNTKGDLYSFIAYGNAPIIDGDTTFYYQFGYTRENLKSSRNISEASAVAKAEYHTNSYMAAVRMEKIYEYEKKWSVKPVLKAAYQYAYTPAYSESGAGNLNLNVNSFHAKSLTAGAGTAIDYVTENNVRFMMNFSLDYDFNAKGQSVDSSFQDGGAVFTTEGIDKNPLIYDVGVGMHENLKKNLTFELKYDYKGRSSGFANHSFYGMLNYKF
jgi:outer membrane autotransporter protein